MLGYITGLRKKNTILIINGHIVAWCNWAYFCFWWVRNFIYLHSFLKQNFALNLYFAGCFSLPAVLPAGWCRFLWWRNRRPAGRSSAGSGPRRAAQPAPRCSATAEWKTWSAHRSTSPAAEHTHRQGMLNTDRREQDIPPSLNHHSTSVKKPVSEV